MDDISFQNMDSWKGGGSKFGLTFKQIILLHINKCVANGSVEFVGGYWDKRATMGGHMLEKFYVPDSREVFCNSVKMLRALLLGYFDDRAEESDNKLKEKWEKTGKKISEEDKARFYKYKVDWHRELFEELILLSKRLNFFEEQSSAEEM